METLETQEAPRQTACKKCRKCGTVKLLTEFYPGRGSCIPCHILVCLRSKNKKPAQYKNTHDKWRERNKEKISKTRKEKYASRTQEERDLERVKSHARYHKNNLRIREGNKRRYWSNREKFLAHGRLWNTRNPEKRREFSRHWSTRKSLSKQLLIPPADVPKALIATIVAHNKLRKLIKKLCKQTTSTN